MTTSWGGSRRSVPTFLRRRILDRDNHTCQACHGTRCGNVRLEIDHRTPIAEGGTDHPDNLAALGAEPCHAEKTEAERLRGIARRSSRRQRA